MHVGQFKITLHHKVKEEAKRKIAESHQVTHWLHDVPRQIAESSKPYEA